MEHPNLTLSKQVVIWLLALDDRIQTIGFSKALVNAFILDEDNIDAEEMSALLKNYSFRKILLTWIFPLTLDIRLS